MANTGRYRTEDPDLLDMIKELRARIERLERVPRASYTAVNTAGITIRGGSLDVSRDDPVVAIHDAYTRYTTAGWGLAENGMVYTVNDGSASAFSTDGKSALIAIPSVNVLQAVLLQSGGIAGQYFDFTQQCSVPYNPVGGYIGLRYDFRWVDVNNRVQVQVNIETTGTFTVVIQQVVASVITTIATGTVPGLAHDITKPFTIRVSSLGRAFRVKVWHHLDYDEPITWAFTGSITDDILAFSTTGINRIGAILQTGNSNTLPVQITFDELTVTSPHYVDVNPAQGVSEGMIRVGSNLSMNNEDGMAIQVYRSSSVIGGDTYPDGTPIAGNISFSAGTVDGSAIDPTFAFPSIQILDKSGDAVLSDSWTARRGLDDPRFSYPFNNNTYATTTSGTFAGIMNCEWYMYHPHLRIRVLVQNDASNTSELRVAESGGAILLQLTTGSGAFQYYDLLIKRSATVNGNGPNGNVAIITLEHRRASGAGTVRTMVLSCVGIDLSFNQPF